MHPLIPATLLVLSLSPGAVYAETGVAIGPLTQSFFPDEDDDRPELFLPEEGDSDPSNFEPREGDSDPANFAPREGDSDPDSFDSPDLDELALPARSPDRVRA